MNEVRRSDRVELAHAFVWIHRDRLLFDGRVGYCSEHVLVLDFALALLLLLFRFAATRRHARIVRVRLSTSFGLATLRLDLARRRCDERTVAQELEHRRSRRQDDVGHAVDFDFDQTRLVAQSTSLLAQPGPLRLAEQVVGLPHGRFGDLAGHLRSSCVERCQFVDLVHDRRGRVAF